MKKVYISGRITGDVLFFPKFAAAEERLQAAGFKAINPAAIQPANWATATWADYMKADIKKLMTADAIFMLKDWRRSRGARLERRLAKKLNIAVYYEKDGVEAIK